MNNSYGAEQVLAKSEECEYVWSMRVGRLQCQDKGNSYMHTFRTYTLYLRIINYVCTKKCTNIIICIKRKAHPHQEDSVSQVKHSIGQLELLCDVAHYR